MLATTLANGAAEEVFFRGALYAAIGEQHPVQLSTLAYALATVPTRNPALVLAASFMGALFGAQRRASGGVQAPALTHLTWSVLMLRYLPRLPFGRRLILETGLGAGQEYGSAPDSDRRWLGKQGRALSPLRPAGIAEIEGARVDIVSDGELIDAGQLVEVTRVDGNRIVVRRVPHINAKE